jgi:repressor LexA
MATLTDRQSRILNYIVSFLAQHSYPPTIREIGSALNISSTSVVNYNLNKLEKAGLIERDSQVSRGLKVSAPSVFTPPEPGQTVRVPVLGTIAAGRPITVPDAMAVHEAEEMIEVTRELLGNSRDVFALHVKGNSMIDAMVSDGDVVVMQATKTASNGEMVAAWITDREETTLKRFFLENGRVRLQPANPSMDPIFVDPANVEIQGRVVAVIRNLN